MRLFKRKSQLDRLVDTVSDSLGAAGKATLSVPRAVGRGKAGKAGLIAGGLAGLTAGSAGISALRRRKEGAGDDS
jgi:hypothetical protein